MAIFKLTALDGSVGLFVRARCLSCARQVAVEHAGAEGTRTWASRQHSTVELIRNAEQHGYEAEGRNALIKRIEHGAS